MRNCGAEVARQNIIDQALHFATAFGLVALASHGSLATGAAVGLGMGLIRETAEGVHRMTRESVEEQLAKRDSQIDLVFWTLGGALAGGLM